LPHEINTTWEKSEASRLDRRAGFHEMAPVLKNAANIIVSFFMKNIGPVFFFL